MGVSRDAYYIAAIGACLIGCLYLRAENATLLAGKESLKRAHAEAITKAVTESARINNDALVTRDTQYSEISEAAITAAVSIATAQRNQEATNEVNPDGDLPLALSDTLIVQQNRIRTSAGPDSPSGANIQPKTSTDATR